MDIQSSRVRTGLVLPGGGARGAFQVGVLRAIADLLNSTEDRRARHALIPILAQVVPAAPDVMEELVADPRWFAVRNAVHAIGEIGSEGAAREHRRPPEDRQ